MSAAEQAAFVLDARLLEPPEPMVQTMEALDRLQPGDKMLLLLYREPHPLYRILATNGYAHSATVQADGTVEILIWKA